MAKRKNKQVVNAATTSEEPQSGKKIRKLRKTGAKITKDSSPVKIAEPEKISIDEGKKVKDNAVIVDIKTQGNEQKEVATKEMEAITKGTVAGLIFMCNSKTKPDCFQYKVMGLPENRKDFVFRIKPGMRLFLYDFDAKLLYGIFKASSFGGMKLAPAAFNGLYPAQVRFEVDSARAPLPYHIFKNAIQDNCTGTRNMFKIELSNEQVTELAKLFPLLPPNQAIFNVNAPPIMRPALAPPVQARPPFQAQAPAPAPAPVRAPATASRPSIPPSINLYSFENLSRSQRAPVPRELAKAPIGVGPHNPPPLTDYRNQGLNPNSFMALPAAAHGGAPGLFPHSYSRLWPESSAPRLVPHAISPYDAPRMSYFDVGPPLREPRHDPLYLINAADAVPYNIRSEQQIGSSGNLGSLPVSSRYSFASPAISFRRGLP